MKNTVLAALIAGSLLPWSAAYAGESHVQLYGIIDLGITHTTGINNGAGGSVSSTGLSSGVQAPSRLGIKGDETISPGLDAIFDAETGFCASGVSQDGKVDGSTPPSSGGYCTGGGFMQRQTWVGLKGDLGTLKLGRLFTPQFLNESKMDPFSVGLNGAVTTLSLTGGQSHFALVRTSQTIEYKSPALSGFNLTAAYSFAPLTGGTVATASAAGQHVPRMLTVSATYASRAWVVGASYGQIANSTLGLNQVGINSGKIDVLQAFGSYDFEVAKVSAIYEKASGDYANGTKIGVAGGRNTFWLVGANMPAGPGNLLVSVSEAKIDPSSVLQSASVQGSSRLYALGYKYPLSRQTDIYASIGHLTNATNTSFAVGTSDDVYQGVPGQSSSGVAFGLRHSF